GGGESSRHRVWARRVAEESAAANGGGGPGCGSAAAGGWRGGVPDSETGRSAGGSTAGRRGREYMPGSSPARRGVCRDGPECRASLPAVRDSGPGSASCATGPVHRVRAAVLAKSECARRAPVYPAGVHAGGVSRVDRAGGVRDGREFSTQRGARLDPANGG